MGTGWRGGPCSAQLGTEGILGGATGRCGWRFWNSGDAAGNGIGESLAQVRGADRLLSLDRPTPCAAFWIGLILPSPPYSSPTRLHLCLFPAAEIYHCLSDPFPQALRGRWSRARSCGGGLQALHARLRTARNSYFLQSPIRFWNIFGGWVYAPQTSC